jgi:hypothetical protein
MAEAESTTRWDEQIAAIDQEIRELQAARAGLLRMRERELAGVVPPPPGGPGGETPAIPPPVLRPNGLAVQPGAYLGLSIGDAANKHLASVKQPMQAIDLFNGLQQGGLQCSYGVLAATLRRRPDLRIHKGKWGLAEWFATIPLPKPSPKKKRKARKAAKEKAPIGTANV